MKISIRLAFLGIFLLCELVFLAHYAKVGNAVWGDGRFYYVYTRSAVIDHDLDFANESKVDPFYFDAVKTPTGKIFNKYSIGAPILWTPFFLVAHGVVLVGEFLKMPGAVADGYGHVYRIAVGMGAVFLGNAGCWFSYFAAKKFFERRVAFLATLLMMIATNAFFYIAVDPINSHSSSIFISGLFVFFLVKLIDKSSYFSIFWLGILTGFLGLIRAQDLLFGISVPLVLLLDHNTKQSVWRKSKLLVSYGVAVALSFLPQILVWLYLFGQITSPYFLAGETFNLLQPKILEVLFSNNNGLFFWSPFLILSVIGLVDLSRKFLLARIGLLLFALEAYTIASWHGWWEGASFGARMFLTLTPFFILGFAQVLQYLEKKFSVKKLLTGILIAGSANAGEIIWFLLHK